MDIFVARQPIFDRSEQVHAYELLYRSNATNNAFGNLDGEAASLEVLSGAILSIGLDQLLGGKKAFINFGRGLLVDELTTFLPPEVGVIEILETVEPDPDVIKSCRKLRDIGYTIALDDFVWDPKFEPLLDLAHIVKVDMRISSREDQLRLLGLCKVRGISTLAEKVETREEFEWCRQAGYDFFQGYFFARPAVVAGRAIQPAKFTCLQMLKEMLHPALDFEALESIIRKDVSLVHKLFSYVNSAQRGRSVAVDSIQRALLHLGEDGIRRWAILATLRETAKNKPLELVTCALVRARFCETVARLAGEPNPLVYMMGLFSVLDGLLDCPLDEALKHIGLNTGIVGEVLLGSASDLALPARVYKAVRSYEAGAWDTAEVAAAELHISASDFCAAYIEATGRAKEELQNFAAAQGPTRSGAESGQPQRPGKRERRRGERCSMNVAMTILWGATPHHENATRATLVDVSARGARLRLAAKVPPGAWLSFHNHALGIGGRGTVRYCNMSKGAFEVGVDIANGTGWGSGSKDRARDLRRLGDAIQRLQSNGVPEPQDALKVP